MAKSERNIPHLSVPIIIIALVAAGAGGLWIAQRRTTAPLPAPSKLEAPPAAAPKGTAPTAPPAMTSVPTTPVAATPPLAAQPVPEEEQQKLHAWLTESTSPEVAGQMIVANWQLLSPRGKLECAPHMLNLTSDEKHAPIAELLMAPETSPEVKELLFNDVLNRGEDLKWPLILRVLKEKGHPQAEQARNILSVVLGQDFGDDWQKWQEHVDTELLKKG
ncbi:MAG: hypothetical protein ACOYMN_14920 [Roseimicrobium sp.]